MTTEEDGATGRNKRKFSALMAALCAFSAALTCGAIDRCRTLHPHRSALAERMAALQAPQTFSSSLLRASVRRETQLNVVDVLIAYDRSAQNWLSANGKGTPLAFARARVAEMNACLANSRLQVFTFRLVGIVCIDEDATRYRDRYGYVDLDWILSKKIVNEYGRVVATGEWAKIPDQREALGADVVSVLVAAGRLGVVGLGYSLEDTFLDDFSGNPALIPTFGDWAYNVCSIEVVDGDYSLLHEIGHNMGCGHPDASCASRNYMDLGPQLYSYSSGYYFWIGDEGFYTIMGYNFGGLRPDGSSSDQAIFTAIPYFSSPLLSYDGVAIGTAYNDNRRTLLNTYAYVAQYRVARLSPGAEPVDDREPTAHVFPTPFRPLKAINGAAPYVGAVYDGDKAVALLSLKCGKVAKSGRLAGTSKVSAAVTGLDCRRKTTKPVRVVCGYDAAATLVVKDWGTLALTLGGEGFVGTLDGRLSVKTASVGGAWPHARAVVDVDFDSGTGALPSGTLTNLLPTGDNAEPIVLSGGKWTFASPAVVKYVKNKDNAAKETSYELQGLSDPRRTNRSALKLTYTPKKGTFKGTFKVYVLETSGTKPRLMKHTAKVTGIVEGSVGYGRAEIRNIGTFPVSIRPVQ